MPTFPVSPEPRAKMIVSGLQEAPDNSPFWVSPVKSPPPPPESRLVMELSRGSGNGEERVVEVASAVARRRDFREGILDGCVVVDILGYGEERGTQDYHHNL